MYRCIYIFVCSFEKVLIFSVLFFKKGSQERGNPKRCLNVFVDLRRWRNEEEEGSWRFKRLYSSSDINLVTPVFEHVIRKEKNMFILECNILCPIRHLVVSFRGNFFSNRGNPVKPRSRINPVLFILQGVRQVYVLVLGLDVLGNPYALITGIGKGVKDLFYEPYQVSWDFLFVKERTKIVDEILTWYFFYFVRVSLQGQESLLKVWLVVLGACWVMW